MARTIIEEEVRQFIATDYLLGRADGLTDGTSFLQEGILDSTGVLQLITFLEKRYGIRVEDEEVVPENLDSISCVSCYVRRKLNGVAEPGDGSLSDATLEVV
jgi:acyl carrier protein